MDSLKEYRNADYDYDPFFDQTTSWPDGLREKDQFVPNLPRPVRLTSSTDDIQRYKDHFLLGQKNMGKWFKWKHYLKLLVDDLRDFDTPVLATKPLVERQANLRESDLSHYVTASETEIIEKTRTKYKLWSDLPEFEKSNYVTALETQIIEKPQPKHKIRRKQSFFEVGDTDSLFSMETVSIKTPQSIETLSTNSVSSAAVISINTNVLLSPQKNYLKPLVERQADLRKSDISHYVTASETEIIEKPQPKDKIWRKQSVFEVGDTDSLFSMENVSIKTPPSMETLSMNSVSSVAGISINSNVPLSPQKNFLKKFCGEIRQLANKTVKKMSVKSKYCSICGDSLGNRKKVHNECPQLLRNVTDRKKSICAETLNRNGDIREVSSEIRQIASMINGMDGKLLVNSKYCGTCEDSKKSIPRHSLLKNTNLARTISMSLTSMTSTDSGDSTTAYPHSAKQMATSHNKKKFPKRMPPFIKE